MPVDSLNLFKRCVRVCVCVCACAVFISPHYSILHKNIFTRIHDLLKSRGEPRDVNRHLTFGSALAVLQVKWTTCPDKQERKRRIEELQMLRRQSSATLMLG